MSKYDRIRLACRPAAGERATSLSRRRGSTREDHRGAAASITGGSPAASLLTIDTQRVGPVAVLTAVGEIDISSADDLQGALETARDGGASELWLDLAPTAFIDCSGLRVLLDLRADLLTEDRRLVLICPPGPVRRLLSLTGAEDQFEIQSTASDDRS